MFPSEYVENCIVTPLPQQVDNESVILESDIPELYLDYTSDIEGELFPLELRNTYRSNKQKQLNTTRSGGVLKNKPKYREPPLLGLEQRFRKQSKK